VLGGLAILAIPSYAPGSPAPERPDALAAAMPQGSLAARLHMPVQAPTAPLVASAAARQAAEIVLSPSDVGPEFILAASSDRQMLAETTRTHFIVRAARRSYVEPDGLSGVSSFAVVAASAARAQDIYASQARDFRLGSQELPLPAIGDRALGVAQWSADPFGGGLKAILFRRGNVVGYIVAGTYEAPTHLDDLAPLAQLMAERANP
jgi:hypothetical protein